MIIMEAIKEQTENTDDNNGSFIDFIVPYLSSFFQFLRVCSTY